MITAIGLILIITKIRQASIFLTLRESETRFRTLVESLPQLVWICRSDGRAIYCNQKWIDFSGMPLADNYGHGWQKILHRADHKRVSEAWQHAVKTGKIFSVEYRLRRADGTFRWMLVRGIPMKDPEGNAIQWLGTCTDIEDQKRIEQELHESERFVRATIDALSKHIAVLDEFGNILAVNKAWRDFAISNGASLTTVSEGSNYLNVCRMAAASGDKDALTVIELINDVSIGTQVAADMEYSCHSPNRQRWFSLRISRFDNAIPIRLVVAHENITERILAQDRIHFQAHLLDTVGQAVIATDLQRKITYWNKFAEKLYGWSFAEVAGRDILDATQIEISQQQREECWSVMYSGDTWSGEVMAKNRKGIRFPAQMASTPILDDSGKLIGIVGISSDISQRKIFENRLQENEQRFKAISTNIPGMVFQLKKKHDGILFTYVSGGALDVYCTDANAIMSRPEVVIDLLDEESAKSFYQTMEQSATKLCVWNWEGKLKPQADEYGKWINLRATPRQISTDCVLWDGVIFNITEAKKYEASLEEKRGLLQDLSAHQFSVKEEERKRIAREIHDELGQRLTVLRMDVLMLRKHPDAQSQSIKDTINRLRDSIDDLLGIIRNIASALRPAALDIGFVMAVEWLIDEFRTTLKIPCTFKNHVVDSIFLDDERATGIFRILQESLTNIMRHARAKNITITLDIKERFLFLKIQDDGIGFSEEYVKSKKSYGLVGMRERAVMLNGELFISSSQTAGTAVNVRIPI
ncbi:MAG: PAS domain-containing sensor histidine kinase [Burkholderiaceae bacterium]